MFLKKQKQTLSPAMDALWVEIFFFYLFFTGRDRDERPTNAMPLSPLALMAPVAATANATTNTITRRANVISGARGTLV